jgi:hypothetical protein
MLATPDDVAAFGYDVELVSPLLFRAETRVRGYLSGRASAVAALASGTNKQLAEVVVAVANRMAATSPQVNKGVQAEALDGGSVTWGSQAYDGTAELIGAEKRSLDKLFPLRLRSVDLLQ